MGDAPAPKPCCVCDATGGKHCTKCKSRHYCCRACQLVDWNEGGHKAQCKQMAAAFQDRLLDELMPAKLKIKEEPPIVADFSPAGGAEAAPRAPVAPTAAAKARAPTDDAPDWRGTCGICMDLLPLGGGTQRFYECCCKKICKACSDKCEQHNDKCPFCRTPVYKSQAEWLRRLQKQVDEGNADAQIVLGQAYEIDGSGVKKSAKRAFQSYELAAVQGHAQAQCMLGQSYTLGHGVKIDYKAAAHWLRRAADQGHPNAQCNLGSLFAKGTGAPQSDGEAVRWYRLAAAQDLPEALYYLAKCYANGRGVPQDHCEGLRLYKCAAAAGNFGAPPAMDNAARLAAHFAHAT